MEPCRLGKIPFGRQTFSRHGVMSTSCALRQQTFGRDDTWSTTFYVDLS